MYVDHELGKKEVSAIKTAWTNNNQRSTKLEMSNLFMFTADTRLWVKCKIPNGDW